ncbi:hypothetical protein [Gimesia aquarii]|uniref:Uncharacterized protein n=1 Tax=Gimesia aquarii TaxID=2527964 RepID=A0A517WWL3_9PLAN|nr:hypothetical protein [Gimesia aquarii]QDU09618.1 hypothetical protein V202x_29940 [Gimesia aquarii]
MAKRVEIEIYHGASKLSGFVDYRMIKDLIEYTTKKFSHSDKGKIQEHVEDNALWDVNYEGKLVVPTGLIPILSDRLRQTGVKVTRTDYRRFLKKQKMSKSVMKKTLGDEKDFLQSLWGNPLGQIEVGRPGEVVQYIEKIARVFPRANILVRTITNQEARRMRNELKSEAPELDARVKPSGGWYVNRPHILFTRGVLMGGCFNKDWDIILLPDAAKVVKDSFRESMGIFGVHPYRCYSFVLPGTSLSSPERLILEAIAGQTIFSNVPRETAVEVLWLKPPSYPTPVVNKRGLAWKQENYWRNDRRNDYIAGIARAFQTDNRKKLKKYGVSFYQGKPHITNPDYSKIVILVESTEAGRELQKRLTAWELRSVVKGDVGNTKPTHPEGQIITATKAEKDGIDADVLVNAAGGQGIGAFRSTIAESATRSVQAPGLIIDLADEFDKIAVEDTRSRCRGYEKRGWKQSGPGLSSSPGKTTKVPVAQEVST